MRVRTAEQIAGPIPSERVVTIQTARGIEQMIVHASQVDASGVEIGVVARKGNEILIELPRETLSGRWRLWVPRSAVS